MLDNLKQEVFDVYSKLIHDENVGSVSLVSARDKDDDFIVVPPMEESDFMSANDMLVLDINGNLLEGDGLIPPDVKLHLEIYKSLDSVYAIAQTYYPYTTAFAQAKRDIPFYGAVHATHFYGDIPCIMTPETYEGDDNFERDIGKTVAEELDGITLDKTPCCLLSSLGSLSFAQTPQKAFSLAKKLERVAHIAYMTENLSKDISCDPNLLEKIFNRSH